MRRIPAIELLAICAITTLALRSGGVAGDPGVGWHIASGNWTIDHRALPSLDPFLNPTPSSPWIHTQWLSDVLFALLYRAGSWPLLELFTILVGWTICFYLFPKALRGVGELGALVGVLSLVLLLSVQWFLRPVLFSFLLFAIVFLLLRPRLKLDRFWRYIPLLFLLWANLHPGFVLGFLLVVLAALSAFLERERSRGIRVGVIGIASIAATFVNPYGSKLHRQIIELGTSRYFQNLNSEWLSADYSLSIFCPFLLVAGIVLYSLLSGRRFGADLFERSAAAVFLVLALNGVRYIPFFGIVASFLVARVVDVVVTERKLLSRVQSILTYRSAVASGTVVIVVGLFVIVSGHFPRRTPEDSSPRAFLPEGTEERINTCRHFGGRSVFASPDLGGIITLASGGDLQPFVDDRNELLGADRYREYFSLVLGWPDSSDKLRQFDCVIPESGAPLEAFLKGDSTWDEAVPGLYLNIR